MDSNSRYLQIALLQDSGTPYDLTGHTARFNARKVDGTHVFNDCVMTDAANGIITVELTDQTLAIGDSIVVADISIMNADGTEVLTTRTFEIKVQRTMLDNNAVESSDEYGAVVTLFQDVWDLREYIRSIGKYTDNVPEGGEPASVVSLWGAFNQFAAWTKTQSTAALVDALDKILVKNIMASDSIIKSIQRGTASTAAGTSVSVNLNSVTVSKCVVLLDGDFGVKSAGGPRMPYVAILNSTYLQINGSGSYSTAADNSYVAWQVIEFY